jgi:glycerophosphoryl diester phosphodiesterase
VITTRWAVLVVAGLLATACAGGAEPAPGGGPAAGSSTAASPSGLPTAPSPAGPPPAGAPAGSPPGPASLPPGTPAGAPLVIGHRGAPGYRPEETVASYELAARMGADYIEADLVPTKDGVLVCRHEPDISQTTDVAAHPEFADRRTTRTIDGQTMTGWFTSDFTLAELKTLHAVERLPDVRQRNTIYNWFYPVLTAQEYLDTVSRMSAELHRPVGAYLETKHPTFFRQAGIDVDAKLVDLLNRNNLNTPNAKIFVESFETNLRQLHTQLTVPLIQLIDSSGAPADRLAAGDKRTFADMTTPAGLADIATYAQGIGPDKSLIVPTDPAGNPGPPTSLVTDAHKVGLKLHPYTFRDENQFLPTTLRTDANPNDYGRAIDEDVEFFRLGVDGIFTDNTDTGVLARSIFESQQPH